MNKQFTFRGMEHSNTIEEYANKQLKKIEHFFAHEKEPIFMHIFLDAQHTHHHHQVNFKITSPLYNLDVHREGPELYTLIIEMVDCMYEQLCKEKRKHIDKNKTGLYKRE